MHDIDPIESVINHIQMTGKITNRECRHLLDTSYDGTIALLNSLCKLGLLSRHGSSSSTHYILAESDNMVEIDSQTKDDLLKRLSRK